MKSIYYGVLRLGILLMAICVSTKAAAPAAPVNVRGSWVNNSSALLTWDGAEAVSYKIFRFDANAQTWSLIAADVGVPMFREEPGFEPPMQYAVSAVNAEGEGDASIVAMDNTGWSGTSIMYYDPSWYPWLNGRTSTTLQFAVSPVDGTDALLEFGSSPEDLSFLEYHAEYAGFHSFVVTNLTAGTQYFFRATFTDTNRLGVSFMQSFYTLPPNQPPLVFDVGASMNEDGGSISIEPSYADQDGYSIPTFRVVTQPANGAVTFDGTFFHYTPNANFFGTDSFTYAAHDGEDESAPATVTIEVASVNDAPLAQNFSITTAEDRPGSILFGNIVLQGSDIDSADLTYIIVEAPSHGTLSGSGKNLFYTPSANYNGADRLLYKVSDGFDESGVAEVTITVTPVDDFPIALPQSVSTLEDQSIAITLTATDIDGGPSSWSVFSAPQNGVLSGTEPNLVYTPNPNFSGTDQFIFRTVLSQATVSIQVTAVNDAPIANNLSFTTAYNAPIQTPLSGSDFEGSPLSFVVDSVPANGTVGGSVPSLHFLPAVSFVGTTTFTYHVNDGAANSALATVTITVLPPATAPASAPSVTAQAVSSTQVNLSWMDSSPLEDGYSIERATGQNWTQVGAVGPGYGPYLQNFSDTTVQPNKTYNYRVRAFNILGNSPYSTPVSVKTLR